MTRNERAAQRASRPYTCPRSCSSIRAWRAGSSAQFIRGHLRQTGFEQAAAGAYLAASTLRSWRTWRSRQSGREPVVRADAVPDVIAGSRSMTRTLVRQLGCHEQGRSTSRRSSMATSTPSRRRSHALRRGNLAARARMLVIYDQSVTWNALVIGTRQQDRSAPWLHHAVWRQRVRLRPDRRPVQEPGAPALRGHRRSRLHTAQAAHGRPLGRPDRRKRAGPAIRRHRPPALLVGRPPADERAARGHGLPGSSNRARRRADRKV